MSTTLPGSKEPWHERISGCSTGVNKINIFLVETVDQLAPYCVDGEVSLSNDFDGTNRTRL